MTAALVALFLASLAVTLAAAGFFARRLDRVGLRLGLPETLLGLLTAVAADAPELSSAIAALLKGEQSVTMRRYVKPTRTRQSSGRTSERADPTIGMGPRERAR